MSVTIPPEVLRETARWMIDFRDYWLSEAPLRTTSRALSEGGTPEWHPEFAHWLGVDYGGPNTDQRWRENPEPRVRTTRAFRKLRRRAVREYEVCYRIIVLGEPIRETCEWLNARAIRNNIELQPGHNVHYTINDTVLLLVSGVTKAAHWWSDLSYAQN